MTDKEKCRGEGGILRDYSSICAGEKRGIFHRFCDSDTNAHTHADDHSAEVAQSVNFTKCVSPK